LIHTKNTLFYIETDLDSRFRADNLLNNPDALANQERPAPRVRPSWTVNLRDNGSRFRGVTTERVTDARAQADNGNSGLLNIRQREADLAHDVKCATSCFQVASHRRTSRTIVA
jgi:hypothetical protein